MPFLLRLLESIIFLFLNYRRIFHILVFFFKLYDVFKSIVQQDILTNNFSKNSLFRLILDIYVICYFEATKHPNKFDIFKLTNIL